jgi:hypothetical protein
MFKHVYHAIGGGVQLYVKAGSKFNVIGIRLIEFGVEAGTDRAPSLSSMLKT